MLGANGPSPDIKSSSELLELSNPFLLNVLPCHTKHWLFSPCLVLGCLKLNMLLKKSQSRLWLNSFVLFARPCFACSKRHKSRTKEMLLGYRNWPNKFRTCFACQTKNQMSQLHHWQNKKMFISLGAKLDRESTVALQQCSLKRTELLNLLCGIQHWPIESDILLLTSFFWTSLTFKC